MKLDEIKTADIEALEARAAEILSENSEELTADELEARAEESEAIEARMKEIKEAEARAAELRAKIADGAGEPAPEFEPQEERNMANIEVRNSKEYIDAFADLIRLDSMEALTGEQRKLLSENATNGVVAVPTIVEDIVKTAWDEEGIMSLVKKTYIAGNLKVSFEVSATGAAIHTEGGDAPSEEQLVLGVVTLVPANIKKWIKVSDEVLDLRGEAFLNYIYREVVYQIAKKAADELIGKIEAAGTVATTTDPGVPTITESTIGLGTIANGIAALSDEAANPIVMMNKATWAKFKEVQYAGGYAVDPFEGLQVKFNNTIKSYTAASSGDTYVIVGDLGFGAQANFPNGEEVKFIIDEKSLAEQDLVKIVGREFVGLGVVAPKAFVKIKK